jgi:hypothetical protein
MERGKGKRKRITSFWKGRTIRFFFFLHLLLPFFFGWRFLLYWSDHLVERAFSITSNRDPDHLETLFTSETLFSELERK